MQQALKDPDLMNFTIQGELRSIKMLDDAVIRQISTSISKSLFSIGTDLAPGVGDVKAFAEAEDAWDYIFASIGVVPGVGDAFALGLRKSKQLLKDGKAQEASELLESLANRASGAKAALPSSPQPAPLISDLRIKLQSYHAPWSRCSRRPIAPWIYTSIPLGFP